MYKLREWQEKYKKIVADKLKEGKIVALQAPTGSGKTIFSLLVGKELGKKIIFLTNFYNEFSRVMEDASKIGLKAIYLVSKVKSCLLYDADDIDPEDIECVFEPNSCKKFCTDISDAVKSDLKGTVFSECSSRCIENHQTICPFRVRAENILLSKKYPIFPDEFIADMKQNGICAYWYTLKELNKYDVIVMHYYYFFHKHINAVVSRYINFKDYLIIVDEAHNLDKINEIYRRTIDVDTVSRAFNELERYLNDKKTKEKLGKELLRISESLKELVNNFKTDKMVYVSKFNNFYISEENLRILEKVCKLISHKFSINTRLNICRVFKFYRDIHENKWPVFLEPGGSFVTMPLTPSVVLSEVFNDDSYDIMVMSGTLPSKEYMRKIWGIERSIEYIDVDYKQGYVEYRRIFDVTTRYIDRNEEMFRKYAEHITGIYNNAKGVVLTVYPSYDVMKSIIKYLNIDNMYVENRNSNLSEVKKLALEKRKLLVNAIAGSKLTEGVELTDGSKSLISDIVIAGIPYPKVDDYLKLRNEEISRSLKENIHNLVMNEIARIRIKQAIGRGIRNKNDRITVWLLDSRFQFFNFN